MDIDVKEFEKMRSEATVIDVLPEKSYEQGHIPGAINIPVEDDDFEERVAAEVDKSDTVIVYCADEECQASPKAARMLEDMGYVVYDFEAGLKGWRDAGHELTGGTRQVQADLA